MPTALPPLTPLDDGDLPFDAIDPAPRLLMGPGPINAHPRVLQALASPLLGQFDPQFRVYMKETMSLYRRVFDTRNRWTFLVDGTARAAIECAMVSAVEPGQRVLVLSFGRFGQLLSEIARRVGADVHVVETEWGNVFQPEQVEEALRRVSPALVAVCHGDTSTTMAQPLEALAALCSAHGAMLQVDATATLGGMPLPVDALHIDCATAGLQKCLGGPSGSAPITLSERMAQTVYRRRHVEEGLRGPDYTPGEGEIVASNYFDLAMLLDYWSDRGLNHHTEATSMLYAARECGRLFVEEGREHAFRRHAQAGRALAAGLDAMGLRIFGDRAAKMPHVTGVHIPEGVGGDRVRAALLADFNIEIGTSFGRLHGRIWRIGTMGVNAREDAVLATLAALEAVLSAEHAKLPRGAAVDAARAVYREAEGARPGVAS
ncbi:MAG TPA: alanine--glyoxylate aminotransferase family protein [Casimicrobiaceae bacterium]|nr:alanine--glyoxylate aminotransferase family protein [Casimicrobiaceae bacterium]